MYDTWEVHDLQEDIPCEKAEATSGEGLVGQCNTHVLHVVVEMEGAGCGNTPLFREDAPGGVFLPQCELDDTGAPGETWDLEMRSSIPL